MSGVPKDFCALKARLSLNAIQWNDLAISDAKKAQFSSTKASRASRQLEAHWCDKCTSHLVKQVLEYRQIGA